MSERLSFSSPQLVPEIVTGFEALDGTDLPELLKEYRFAIRFDVADWHGDACWLVAGNTKQFAATAVTGADTTEEGAEELQNFLKETRGFAGAVDVAVTFKTSDLALMFLRNQLTDAQWMRLLARGSIRLRGTNGLAMVRAMEGPLADLGVATGRWVAADEAIHSAELSAIEHTPWYQRHSASDMLSGAWLLLAGCVVYLLLPLYALYMDNSRVDKWCELAAALCFVCGAASLVYATYPQRLLSLMGGLASSASGVETPQPSHRSVASDASELSAGARIFYSNWMLLGTQLFNCGLLAYALEGVAIVVFKPMNGDVEPMHGKVLIVASLVLFVIMSLLAQSKTDDTLRETQGKGSSYAFDFIVGPLLAQFGGLLNNPHRYEYWRSHLGTDTLFTLWVFTVLLSLATAYGLIGALLNPFNAVKWFAILVITPFTIGCALMLRAAYPENFNASLLWSDGASTSRAAASDEEAGAKEATPGEGNPPAAFWPEDQPPAVLQRTIGTLFSRRDLPAAVDLPPPSDDTLLASPPGESLLLRCFNGCVLPCLSCLLNPNASALCESSVIRSFTYAALLFVFFILSANLLFTDDASPS